MSDLCLAVVLLSIFALWGWISKKDREDNPDRIYDSELWP